MTLSNATTLVNQLTEFVNALGPLFVALGPLFAVLAAWYARCSVKVTKQGNKEAIAAATVAATAATSAADHVKDVKAVVDNLHQTTQAIAASSGLVPLDKQ